MDQPNVINAEVKMPQLSFPDHDLLIKLDTKMDGLTNSFNQYYTDLTLRVSHLESRAEQEDLYHASIDLVHFRSNSEWVDNFRANERFVIALGGIITSLLGGLIAFGASRLLHL